MITLPHSLNIAAVKMKSALSGGTAEITILESIGRKKFTPLLAY